APQVGAQQRFRLAAAAAGLLARHASPRGGAGSKRDASLSRAWVSPDGNSVLDWDRLIGFHGCPMARRPKEPKVELQAPRPRVRAVPLSQVEAEETRYLVDPYLPLGTLCRLEGDPGAGKSHVAVAIGAALTLGRVPDLGVQAQGTVSSPRAVLYVTTED